jgi:hypothetical protein|uniref:Uncharacterized protein n=1 Tax=Sipha flava TaxID=143950 RepID=A0A2S2QLQ8_9HEMI
MRLNRCRSLVGSGLIDCCGRAVMTCAIKYARDTRTRCRRRTRVLRARNNKHRQQTHILSFCAARFALLYYFHGKIDVRTLCSHTRVVRPSAKRGRNRSRGRGTHVTYRIITWIVRAYNMHFKRLNSFHCKILFYSVDKFQFLKKSTAE